MSPFLTLQRLLPRRALSSAVGWLTALEGGWLTRLAITAFVRTYGVNMREAAPAPADGYASFNAFFTRALASGARPQPTDPNVLASPADGVISECGPIEADRLLQAKGIHYRIEELLGDDPARAARYRDGHFLTIYLAPYNYHRVHMPLRGTATAMRHLPGDLWSVNDTTARGLAGLFCRNERVCVHFDCDGGGFALVMVGAMNVGSIELTLPAAAPFMNRPQPRGDTRLGDGGEVLDRGAEFGRFNMGSTVIMLTTPGLARWRSSLRAGVRLEVGQPLGALERGD